MVMVVVEQRTSIMQSFLVQHLEQVHLQESLLTLLVVSLISRFRMVVVVMFQLKHSISLEPLRLLVIPRLLSLLTRSMTTLMTPFNLLVSLMLITNSIINSIESPRSLVISLSEQFLLILSHQVSIPLELVL